MSIAFTQQFAEKVAGSLCQLLPESSIRMYNHRKAGCITLRIGFWQEASDEIMERLRAVYPDLEFTHDAVYDDDGFWRHSILIRQKEIA